MSDNNMNLSPQELKFLNSLPKKPSRLDKETMMASDLHKLVIALEKNSPDLADSISILPKNQAVMEFNALAASLKLPEDPLYYEFSDAKQHWGSALENSAATTNEYFIARDAFKDYLIHWNARVYSENTTSDGMRVPLSKDVLEAKCQELRENSAVLFTYISSKYFADGKNPTLNFLVDERNDLAKLFRFDVEKNISVLQEKNAEYSLNWIEKRFAPVYDEVAQIDCSDLTTNETITFRTKQMCRNIAESNSANGLSLDGAGDFEDAVAVYVKKRMQHRLDLESQVRYLLDETNVSPVADRDFEAKPLDILGSIKAKMAAFRNTSVRKNTGPSGPN